MFYSDKLVMQCLGELLKKYQIKDVVCSPGSRNAPIMSHFSAIKEIETYSVVDERSAAFFALGMAQQTRKPVALSCTSGSAVANYYPAVTEAFYQNIPLIILSADRPTDFVDQFDGQTIRQHNIFVNHSHANVTIDETESIKSIEKKIEETIITCLEKQGPVHINLAFSEPLYQKVAEVNYKPNLKKRIKKEKFFSKVKIKELAASWSLSSRKIVLVGVQQPNKKLEKFIKELSKDDSVVVLTESTANINYKRFFSDIDSIIFSMNNSELEEIKPDLLLTIGQNIVSKKVKSFLRDHSPKNHWHLDKYWQPNTYGCLTKKIKTNPVDFSQSFLQEIKPNKSNYYKLWREIADKREIQHKEYLNAIPYCDLKVFEKIMLSIPKDYMVQLGNSTIIRYAQLFKNIHKNETFSNRGTSGIDGCTSTAIGAAFATNKPMLFVTGDLSFLYDSNALWNNYITNKVRIIVMNNGGGNIFKFIPGPSATNVLEKHFEHKHHLKMDLLAKMHGFSYLNTCNETELHQTLISFFDESEKPKILEIDTKLANNAQILQQYFKALH